MGRTVHFLATETRLDYGAIMYDRSFKSSEDSSPFCHLLPRTSSRQETWALFSLRVPIVFTLPALALAERYLQLQSAVCSMNATLRLGNYSAHIHQAHIFMSFMRNYWDKTHSYHKCAWLWSLHQNSQRDSAPKYNGRKSFFMAPNFFFFFHFQSLHKNFLVWLSWFTVRLLHWHSFINYGNHQIRIILRRP